MDTYHVFETDQSVAALSNMATELTDKISGYTTMLEKADDDLRPIVERLITLHETHAARLLEVYREHGGDPESAGSLMGAVHTAVVHARDWAGLLDASALDAIIAGEQRLLAVYDEAAQQAHGDDDMRDLLVSQRAALASHVAALSGS